MKQTAIEFLVDELNQKIDFIPMDKWDKIRDIVQQAKEMEKEQIMNAWYNGFEENRPYVDHSEDYYIETYKQD